MKLYIVMVLGGDWIWVSGVFSSEEKAVAYITGPLGAVQKGNTGEYERGDTSYEIVVRRLDLGTNAS